MIQWPVPQDVYPDTGVFVAAIFPGTLYSDACRQFCDDLAAANSNVYTAHIARLDMARAFRRLATKPGRLPEDIQVAFELDQWATNPLFRSRWLWHGAREFERLVSQFYRFTEIPFTLEIWRSSIDLMAAETLDSSDATHLASARIDGVPDFATTDADFRRISSPHIHLIRPS